MPRASKYGNHAAWYTDLDGASIYFHSAWEAQHWDDLLLRQRAGTIRDLRRQVPYAMWVGGVLVTTYIADYVYQEGPAWDLVVEDAKGVLTTEYKIKAKLMRACHGITIREVRADGQDARARKPRRRTLPVIGGV